MRRKLHWEGVGKAMLWKKQALKNKTYTFVKKQKKSLRYGKVQPKIAGRHYGNDAGKK